MNQSFKQYDDNVKSHIKSTENQTLNNKKIERFIMLGNKRV